MGVRGGRTAGNFERALLLQPAGGWRQDHQGGRRGPVPVQDRGGHQLGVLQLLGRQGREDDEEAAQGHERGVRQGPARGGPEAKEVCHLVIEGETSVVDDLLCIFNFTVNSNFESLIHSKKKKKKKKKKVLSLIPLL